MKFDYARDALKFLIQKYSIKECYIPYYLCDVIRHAIFEVGAKPKFYHIDDSFMPSTVFPKKAYILYPNYFGVCDKNVRILVDTYPNLIVDNAHACYAKPQGLASFDSERKFLNTEKGANLYFGNELNLRKPHLKRREKFLNYHKSLKDKNCLKIELEKESIPFCYPYLASSAEEADEFVNEHRELIIYRYWNCLPKSFSEYKFYSRLVPIPL